MCRNMYEIFPKKNYENLILKRKSVLIEFQKMFVNIYCTGCFVKKIPFKSKMLIQNFQKFERWILI